MPHVPMSAWLYYITVTDLDHAANRITESGGRIVHGPIEVPGGGHIVNAMDNQGAMFALYQNPKA